MLERPGALASGPDGNGGVFNVLEEAGLLSQWNETGVKYLCVMQVDNPLAEPFDFDLIGAIVQEDSDGAIKAVQRKDPLESVGMIVDIEGKVSVAEYSDLSMMQRTATTPLGELLFPLANTGIMCFSLDFVQRALQLSDRMPWHLAHKTASIWSASLSYHKEPIVKFETFIFDVFALARRISVISANREECYSPLKNKEGDKGIAAVQKDLLAIYKRMYTALSGLPAPERDFELGPAFAYPTAIMQKQWKGKALPDSEYIDS